MWSRAERRVSHCAMLDHEIFLLEVNVTLPESSTLFVSGPSALRLYTDAIAIASCALCRYADTVYRYTDALHVDMSVWMYKYSVQICLNP